MEPAPGGTPQRGYLLKRLVVIDSMSGENKEREILDYTCKERRQVLYVA
jgi:hypothetical protein